ncbi:MAG: hypothetical protein J7L66_06020 [Anaerolineaceae bacterium]|nr:hypothetical protein [Anaerolineaceae bacterium]
MKTVKLLTEIIDHSGMTVSSGSVKKKINNEYESFLLTFSQDWQDAEIFTAIDARSDNKQNVKGSWTLEPGGSVLIDLKPSL